MFHLLANTLTGGQIVAVVFSVLIFIGLASTCVIVCVCCLSPNCRCHYNRIARMASAHRIFTTKQASQLITATTDSTKATTHQPLPVDNLDTEYKPCPVTPPTATTTKQ